MTPEIVTILAQAMIPEIVTILAQAMANPMGFERECPHFRSSCGKSDETAKRLMDHGDKI